MFAKPRKCWTALALLLAVASNTFAGTGAALSEYNVSMTEQNRLAIDGRKITQIIPKQKGALTYVKDLANGVLYFTFADPDAAQGTESLFVVDDHNDTYQLLLQPRRMPSANIVVPAAGGGEVRRTQAIATRTSSYQSAIKSLLEEMVTAHDDQDAQSSAAVTPVNQTVPLWQEAQLTLELRYTEDDLVGEQYRLTNVSTGDMVIAEQELYRKGVLAIVIDQQTLAPGDSTAVYVVRGRADHE
ncbi:TraK domain-containing protein [Burkholderia ubonensis]|uniref:TraK domain-containing protein n=1 Tax=Burkholderia ubonensis TaxID=101571 RepID=UPI0009B4CE22|nr:type-F conjugative transfer system secretin TraK [Burkholderia ubonensis]